MGEGGVGAGGRVQLTKDGYARVPGCPKMFRRDCDVATSTLFLCRRNAWWIEL